VGLPLIGYGLIYAWGLALAGVVVVLAGIYGWAFEPSTEPGDSGGHGAEPAPQAGPVEGAVEPALAGGGA